MPGDRGPLWLVRLRLDPRKLIELGRRRRLPIRELDVGYLVHCMLGELFRSSAPRPFALRGSSGRAVQVLAYSAESPEALRRRAQTSAEPWVRGASNWDDFAGKAMPEQWTAGSRLAFTVRVCPVVRMPRGSTTHRPGAELDAFLARCEDGVLLSRETVYREWFQSRIPERVGTVLSVRMEAFKLERLVRRSHGQQRSSTVNTRPDVRLAGEMELLDSDAFNELLRSGVGRHRAFGFGMVLVRPAPR